MQHIPCSWEKDYSFQPNIRAAKDDWQTATRATYLYPPRSASAASTKRNDARFVQASTLGMTSHRHPVGLAKRPGTGIAMSAAVPRPGTSGMTSMVGDRAPSSQVSTYHVTKSDYRPSATASGGGRAGSTRPQSRAASAVPSTVSRRNAAGRETTDSFYRVAPDGDDRGDANAHIATGHTNQGREFSTMPPESRERMYKESVRDRSNEHLRSGAVEPEWERQRIVMDMVGAKSAEGLIEQGYDQRYRPAGGMLDVRRTRRTMSARDRAMMTHELFPESYRNGRPNTSAKANAFTRRPTAKKVRGPSTPGAAEQEQGEGREDGNDGYEDGDDDRRYADGRLVTYGPTASPPYMYPDDRLGDRYTRAGLMGGPPPPPLAEVSTLADHRAGLYAVPNEYTRVTDTFDTIAARYSRPGSAAAPSAGGLETSYYPHPQGRPLVASACHMGPEVSVYHGRNGPLFVADVHSDVLGGGAGRCSAGADPVLSPPRGLPAMSPALCNMDSGDISRASLLERNERSRLGGYTPHVLDRTPPPALAGGGAYPFRPRQSSAVRVLHGRAGPVIVDAEGDVTPYNNGGGTTPRHFKDDRDVFVADTNAQGDRDGYIRLSPQQVREAQQQLDTSGVATSFTNPHWGRRLSVAGDAGGYTSGNTSMVAPLSSSAAPPAFFPSHYGPSSSTAAGVGGAPYGSTLVAALGAGGPPPMVPVGGSVYRPPAPSQQPYYPPSAGQPAVYLQPSPSAVLPATTVGNYVM